MSNLKRLEECVGSPFTPFCALLRHGNESFTIVLLAGSAAWQRKYDICYPGDGCPALWVELKVMKLRSGYFQPASGQLQAVGLEPMLTSVRSYAILCQSNRPRPSAHARPRGHQIDKMLIYSGMVALAMLDISGGGYRAQTD